MAHCGTSPSQALRQLNIDVALGEAKFVDENMLSITQDDGSVSTVRPKYGVVVATGAQPRIPTDAIAGLAETPFVTYEEIFNLPVQPKQLTIIGGGPVGCELAQAFQRLGTQVTVVAPVLLPGEDPVAGQVLESVFAKEGVARMKGLAVSTRPLRNGHEVTVALDIGGGGLASVTGDVMLVAVGRVARVSGLGLEAAGVSCQDGSVDVNSALCTSNKRVFAAGDCTGGPQYTHVAGFQGAIAARNLLLPLSDKGLLPGPPPGVTFTSPEVASVGLSEATARAASKNPDRDVAVVVKQLDRVDRALCDADEPEGLIKIVYRPKDGAILGESHGT